MDSRPSPHQKFSGIGDPLHNSALQLPVRQTLSGNAQGEGLAPVGITTSCPKATWVRMEINCLSDYNKE